MAKPMFKKKVSEKMKNSFFSHENPIEKSIDCEIGILNLLFLNTWPIDDSASIADLQT